MSNFCILCTTTGDKDIWGSRYLSPLVSSRIGGKDIWGSRSLSPLVSNRIWPRPQNNALYLSVFFCALVGKFFRGVFNRCGTTSYPFRGALGALLFSP